MKTLAMSLIVELVQILLTVGLLVEGKPSILLNPLHSSSGSSSNSQESSLHLTKPPILNREVLVKNSQVGQFSAQDGLDFSRKIRSHNVVALLKGCGREPNRLAVLDDGSRACCRYREWEWRELRAELYSYHFNNLLGLHNSPPTILVRLNYSSPQWAKVTQSLRDAKWKDHKVVSMTKFVDNITPVAIPKPFKRSSPTIRQEDLPGFNGSELLLQWSDMIVFDFVIGHSDRIFNTLLNLQWYSKMMDKPVHNLWKTDKDGKFLLIDNESGFWMGYKLGWNDQRKTDMQAQFLKKLCVFRTPTVDQVSWLIKDAENNPKSKLEDYIKSVDPQSFGLLRKMSRKEGNEFDSRLRKVDSHIKSCSLS